MILEKEMQKRKIQRLLKSNDSLILKNKELIEENTILKKLYLTYKNPSKSIVTV